MSQLERLAQQRNEILLADIGAWLHMLGKYDWRFIESHCGGATGYDYRNFILSLQTQHPHLFKLLDVNSIKYQATLSALPISSPSSVGIFIRDHRQTNQARQDKLNEQLTMLLVDAHGRGSNIEKSEIRSDFPSQNLPHVYLSTTFGFDQQLTIAKYKTNILYQALDDLLQQLSTTTDTNKWVILAKQVRSKLFCHFQTVPAETRLPFNDVTLLDQTASTVAFFTSALAERVVAGSWKKLMVGSVNQYKWRTLTIPFAGLEYLQNVTGVADLLGRQNLLVQAQDAVQTLLEFTYPIGQEIYRDERISVFLVPDEANLLQWQNSTGRDLETLIQQEISQATAGDLFPELRKCLMSQGTRTLYTIGRQINFGSDFEMTSDIEMLRKAWQTVAERQVCTNCGLRPQGPSTKASTRQVCDICLNRREQRSKVWATKELDNTIWLDEVADDNGRLALLIGSWDLINWLNGTLIDTIIAASSLNFTQLERDCRISLQKTNKGNPQQFQGLLTSLLKNDVRQQFSNQFRGYFDAIIQPEWQHLTTGGLAEETIAAIHFVRQNPSFARIRRIWDTTRQFWQAVCPTDPDHDVQQSLASQIISNRPLRLEITGTFTSLGTEKTPGFYHAYDLKVTNNVKLSAVWDSAKNRFITCDNLEYLAKPEILGQPVLTLLVKGKTITIEEASGYGSQSKIWGTITVDAAQPLTDSAYTPAIPILAEPRTFMALVPADKALDVIDAIRLKYEREMGKVRNRLPLHLGAVYFHRRTPLRAVLDAGRRMLQQKPLGGDTPWTVKQVQQGPLPAAASALADGTQQFNTTICVQLQQNERTFTWHVPTVMGDGVTVDNWYPYVFFHTDQAGNPEPVGRTRSFKGLRPVADDQTEQGWLVHAAELREEDQIYFTPATFDFEWLDTAANRFTIAYDKQTGQRLAHATRPYLLDDLVTFQQIWQMISSPNGLTSSQIYALRDLLESKRETWAADETFTQLCRDAVHNAQWQEPQAIDLERITNAAIRGQLADIIQLYMGIMKEKPHRTEEDVYS